MCTVRHRCGSRICSRTPNADVRNASSSVVDGTWGRNSAIRSHTLQIFEEVTARGKDKGRVFGDDGLVGLHSPCEFIVTPIIRTLILSLGRTMPTCHWINEAWNAPSSCRW